MTFSISVLSKGRKSLFPFLLYSLSLHSLTPPNTHCHPRRLPNLLLRLLCSIVSGGIEISLERRTSKGGIDQLTQNVVDMSLSSGHDGDWETVNKKNRNRGGTSVARQWVSQSSAPKAWGQPDTSQRLGLRGGKWQNSSPYSDLAAGRGGRPLDMAAPQNVPSPVPHTMNWAARVGSSQVKAAQDDEKERDDSQKAAADEVDDDDDDVDAFSDDEDDDILSDGFDSDESSSSHENLKSHRMLKGFFENLDKLTLDEISNPTRQWHCPACQGGPGAIDWYRGLQPLAMHAKTKGSKRVRLHRVFAQLLEEELRMRGTSVVPAGEFYGNWEGLNKETKKDHKIVWPPMVLIMNTRLEKGDDNKWLGMGNQELLDYFSAYSAVKAQHSYGPQGHRGISVLIFESSAVGYLEAERLHQHFVEEGTGRQAWEQQQRLFNHGGRRQLYGCLATKEDLEIFNRHCQGKQRLKYEMRSYHEMVVSQMKQMSEDNQQLTWLEQKVAEEKRHSKALEETLSLISEKLRKTTDENRIVKQRSKMHHEQNQEEMDFQDEFFRDQMKQIQESLSAKEDNFEKVQQDERKKVEELNSHASSAADPRRRVEEVERFIKSQDQEMSHFVHERDELEKTHEKNKEALKKRYFEEMLALENEFDASLTQLMEKYAPGSTQGDA